MLRKRSRSHHKDQQNMGQSEVLGQKQKTNSFFSVPGLFVGFSPKGEIDSVRSPTSPLDFRVFSNLGNPFRSPRSPHEGHNKSCGSNKVGLSIIESLEDETKESGKIFLDSKSIVLGPQLRIKTSNVRSRFDSFEAPNSLPKNCAIFPYPHTKQSNPQRGNSNAPLGIQEAFLEAKPFGKILSCSLDSKSHFGLTNGRTNSSSRKFCLGNGIQNFSNSPGTKQTKILESVDSGNGLIGSLSASEIELSEDYTCVRTHGPNPKTTHIFGDCILECHNNEFINLPMNKELEIPFPREVRTSYPSDDFLSFCYACKKKLEGEDIYMYRYAILIFKPMFS